MKKIFVIVTNQRSGSTALIKELKNNLNDLDCEIFEELFLNVKVIETLNLYPNFIDILPDKRFYEQRDSIQNYLIKIGQNKNIIFKLMFDQINKHILVSLNELNAEFIIFNRDIKDSSKSAAHLKRKLNPAHKSDLSNNKLNKLQTNREFSVPILALQTYYYIKFYYLRIKYKKLIESNKNFYYPDFKNCIHYIKENIEL